MDQDELLKLFTRLASEISEKDLQGTSMESNIASMGIDSLQMLEIVGALEQELEIDLPDDQLVGIETVGDLLNFARTRLAASKTG